MAEVPSFSNPLQFDHLLLEPVHELMATGMRVDQAEKKRKQDWALEEWQKYQTQLDEIAGMPLNVESKTVIPHLLYDELGLPKRMRNNKPTADEAALRAIMAECKSKIDSLKTLEARARWMEGYLLCYYILKVRGVRTKISRYLGLSIEKGELSGPSPFEDPDGRIRGTISVGGTESARFSHSKTLWDTGVNLATVPRELRSMYIPDDGYEMAEFDLQRGESWVYAHLSEDPELLRIHLEGLDFHAETASTISVAFGEPLSVDWVIEHKDDDAYKIRFLGKKTNHASSYRMGPFKGAETVNDEADETGITCTVGEFRKAQDLWLARYFMIKSWWDEIERELGKTRTLRTPYGRVHSFHDHWGEGLFKAATAWVPQSTSVDYINRGLLRTYFQFQVPGAWGLKILAQTHDSMLVQYKEEHRDEAVPSIASILPSTLCIKDREFSIPIEAKVGSSWGTLHGFSI